ncbi:UNVERIFIED_CONTAM: hypothetical protein GTU68_058737, partial [Idotea baltica]|nr:hypothetical protein [Idotea baltica]
MFSISNYIISCRDLVFNVLFNYNIFEKSLVCWIYIIVFVILFLISCFGRQLGLRRKYIKFLLKIFEFGSNRIKKKREKQNFSRVYEDEAETPSFEYLQSPHFSWEQASSSDPQRSNSKYHLGDILPYVNAGISTIVEDAVIPQFVSEELPYWN